MRADDPRHGSEAGHEQHLRDGEQPCEPCINGDILAGRRRSKRRSMGHVYQRPIGEQLSAKLAALRAKGATHDDIAAWAGISPSQAWRACRSQPDALVYSRTWIKLHRFQPGPIYTTIGITRRLQALVWMGYSTERIATETGCHVDTIRDALAGPRVFLARKVMLPIVDAFERLCMTVPTGQTRQERAGVTRSRNRARRNGWHSPMAWDSIDAPDEQPTGMDNGLGAWAEFAAARIDALEDYADQGMTLDGACAELGITDKSLWKWLDRYGRRELYERLAARQRVVENRFTRGAVA